MSARVSTPASALDPSHGDPPAPSFRPRLDPREAPFSLCPPLLLPDLEQRILRMLRDAGSPVKSVQLAKECQVPKKKLNQVLYRMEKESKVSLAGLAMWRLGEGGTGEVVPTEPAQLSQGNLPPGVAWGRGGPSASSPGSGGARSGPGFKYEVAWHPLAVP